MTGLGLPPLTVSEARAILIADRALVISFETREQSADVMGFQEQEAWIRLVASAKHRITLWEGRR